MRRASKSNHKHEKLAIFAIYPQPLTRVLLNATATKPNRREVSDSMGWGQHSCVASIRAQQQGCLMLLHGNPSHLLVLLRQGTVTLTWVADSKAAAPSNYVHSKAQLCVSGQKRMEVEVWRKAQVECPALRKPEEKPRNPEKWGLEALQGTGIFFHAWYHLKLLWQLILYVKLTGPQGNQICGQTLFWVFLWGWFWISLTLKSVDWV